MTFYSFTFQCLNYHNLFYSDFLLIFFCIIFFQNFSDAFFFHWILNFIYAFTSQPQPSLLLWCNLIIFQYSGHCKVSLHCNGQQNYILFILLTFNESEEKKQNIKWETFIIFNMKKKNGPRLFPLRFVHFKCHNNTNSTVLSFVFCFTIVSQITCMYLCAVRLNMSLLFTTLNV